MTSKVGQVAMQTTTRLNPDQTSVERNWKWPGIL